MTPAVLVLAAGAALVQAPSAAASASAPSVPAAPAGPAAPVALRSWTDCPQGRMCIWRLPNARGSRGSYAKVARDLSELGGGLNDHSMSFWNRTGKTWCMYSDARFKGESRKYPREPLVGAKGNTGQFGYKVSSLRPAFLGRC
ncbi:peptidase inhibitor family I36 protein [Actinomadura luteofluorescens]|uniref:peptidase inhibitor family I36 protein n=1 Tax=Actinomadura luteofluorescens TaxID=46163 RepID=UPI0034969C0B